MCSCFLLGTYDYTRWEVWYRLRLQSNGPGYDHKLHPGVELFYNVDEWGYPLPQLPPGHPWARCSTCSASPLGLQVFLYCIVLCFYIVFRVTSLSCSMLTTIGIGQADTTCSCLYGSVDQANKMSGFLCLHGMFSNSWSVIGSLLFMFSRFSISCIILYCLSCN